MRILEKRGNETKKGGGRGKNLSRGYITMICEFLPGITLLKRREADRRGVFGI